MRRVELSDRHVGDNLERLADVVEHEHRVGEHQAEIRRADVVARRRRDAWFEASHDIVGEKADLAAEKSRKFRKFRRAELFHLAAQFLEWIVDPPRLDRASWPYQIHPVVTPAHDRSGLGTKERVTPPLFTAAHALQQKTVVAARDFQIGGDRRFEIRGNLVKHRYQVETFCRQFFELTFAWFERHPKTSVPAPEPRGSEHASCAGAACAIHVPRPPSPETKKG